MNDWNSLTNTHLTIISERCKIICNSRDECLERFIIYGNYSEFTHILKKKKK